MRKLFNAYNSEDLFKVLVAAEDKNDALNLAKEYAEDAKLTANWDVWETTLQDVENTLYSCEYLIQNEEKYGIDDVILIGSKELKEFFFSSKWTQKVFIANETDGCDFRTFVMVLEIADCVDFKEAIEAACKEYCLTEEGKRVFEHNCRCFNWGDFDLHVPNSICEKHGIRKLQFEEAENIYFNQQLVNEYDICSE